MYFAPKELSNGLRCHCCKTANTNGNIYISLTVKAGSLCDKIQGSAHFLEHILLAFVKMYGYNKNNRLSIGGKTSFDRTSFYFGCTSETFKETIELAKVIMEGLCLQEKHFLTVKQDVLMEYDCCCEAMQRESAFLTMVSKRLSSYMPIGTKKSIESLTFDDIKNFYNAEYSLKNMLLTVIGCNDDKVIEEVFNENSHIDFMKQNNTPCRVAEPSYKKETKNTEIFIPLSYPPLTHQSELQDAVSLSIFTGILNAFPSQDTICLGLKEYSKDNRFISIQTSSGVMPRELLTFIKKNLSCYSNNVDLQCLQNEVRKKLIAQISGPELLYRIEDFFTYDIEFYYVEEIIEQVMYITSDTITTIINYLLSTCPILVENSNVVAVRKTDDWSVF